MKPPKRPSPGKRRLGVSSNDPGIQRMLRLKEAGRGGADIIINGSPRGPKGRVLNPITDIPKPNTKRRLQQFGRDLPDERPPVS